MNFKRNSKNTSYYLFIGICLIFVGYVIFSRQNTETIKQVVIPTPTSSPILTYAKVVRVIDGDTIIIETGQHVRYIGMNTPEVETSECFATEASEINKNLVLGKVVKLEKDLSETDKYGRLLRFVFVKDAKNVGDIFVDDYLLGNGYAKVMTVPPDIKYKDQFSQSEKQARENSLGLWSKCF